MADILIRGMEMPKTCGDCPLSALRMDCKLTGRDISHDWMKRKIPDWCPLVPLPEGHGDLIEKKLAKAKFCQFCFWKHQNKDACERCAGCPIDFIPTIVPTEGGG